MKAITNASFAVLLILASASCGKHGDKVSPFQTVVVHGSEYQVFNVVIDGREYYATRVNNGICLCPVVGK